jgi:hypothetical protein
MLFAAISGGEDVTSAILCAEDIFVILIHSIDYGQATVTVVHPDPDRVSRWIDGYFARSIVG